MDDGELRPAEAVAPITIEHVAAALYAAGSPQGDAREPAEAALEAWGAAATPGYLEALLSIVGGAADVAQPAVRLLAAILVKHVVSGSGGTHGGGGLRVRPPAAGERGALGTAGGEGLFWTCLPEAERARVRGGLLALLGACAGEPRVATQLGLVVAAVARRDFPARWATIVDDIARAAAWGAGVAPPPGAGHNPAAARAAAAAALAGKRVAARCLKQSLRALRERPPLALALLDEWRQRCAAFAEGSAAACAVAADSSRDGDDVELADWAVHGELAICQASFWLSEKRTSHEKRRLVT